MPLESLKPYLLDPSTIKNNNERVWEKAPFADNFSSLNRKKLKSAQNYLFPISLKIERVALADSTSEVAIGGLCHIFTGDLSLSQSKKQAVKLLRMDQITEAIGTTSSIPLFLIFEDSFFSKLTGINVSDFQKQADKSLKAIENWIKLSSGKTPDILTAFTSNQRLSQTLFDAVSQFANDELRNSDFTQIDTAPILLMYTSIWSEILSNLNIIPSKKVICIEPINHFIANRKFPEPKLQNAFQDFLEWLKDNPYGQKGSKNQNFSIAGFQEAIESGQKKRRTRLLPFSQVPNSENLPKWKQNLKQEINRLPFPLRNSLIFSEAVNWTFWNIESIKTMKNLATLEDLYYLQKSRLFQNPNPQQASDALKIQYTQETIPLQKKLAEAITATLNTVLG